MAIGAAILAVSLLSGFADGPPGTKRSTVQSTATLDARTPTPTISTTTIAGASLETGDYLVNRSRKPDPRPSNEGAVPAANSLPDLKSFRVGLQAGHWKSEEFPDELSGVKGLLGASGEGWNEVDVNLELARGVADLLASEGIRVDVLPAVIPPHYTADAFVALHVDYAPGSPLTGFKLARSIWSVIPEKDEALLNELRDQYEAGTGLPENVGTISDNMTEYYTFNNRKHDHAVDPSTPATVLEMGFLSNPKDRELLLHRQEVIARSIAEGILRFLRNDLRGRPGS